MPPVYVRIFPPFFYLVSHRLSIEQEAHAEPSPAVVWLTTTNPAIPSLIHLTILPYSNSPRRLTTYRTRGIFIGTIEGFPKVLGFGGTGSCVHVSVHKTRDV